MRSNRSNILYVLLAIALALLWLVMFLFGTGSEDLAVLSAFYAGHRPMLADAARLMTLLGGWYFITPLVATVGLVVAIRGRLALGLLIFVGISVGRLLVELQKYELGRMRPDQNPHLVNVYNLSFPSGHSANAMMVYVGLAALLVSDQRKRSWCMAGGLLLTLIVGFSRVMLGVHWPSDVIAGWSFGALWVLFMLWLAPRISGTVRAKGRVQ